MNFAGKWMETEQIMFSEESQIKKNKCHMIPLISDSLVFQNLQRWVHNLEQL